MAAPAPPQYTYAPPPNEAPYYDALFRIADTSSSGYLAGPAAVEFLGLSRLPVDLLKQIWTMADQPATNALDAHKFAVAVRLIQLFQNGKKPVDLALNLGEGDREGVRPPIFEGVDVRGAMAAMAAQRQQQGGQPPPQQPQQQQQPAQPSPMPSPRPSPPRPSTNGAPPPTSAPQQPVRQPQLQPSGGATVATAAQPPAAAMTRSTALAVQDPYAMTPQEQQRYEALFPSYAQPDDANNPASPKFVHGGAAVELFSKSGMDRDSLKQVWTMVDDPVDNKLDAIEFSVAMHLIVCVTKKGLAVPPGGLPGSLKAAVAAARGQGLPGGGPPAQQQQTMTMHPPPPSPGTTPIPSPEKVPGMNAMPPQQPQMNGAVQGMQSQQPQMGMQPQPQMGMQQPQMGMQQPQMGMQQPQMGMQPQPQMGGSVGGLNVDDAFAGLSNEPVPSVEEYSTIGSVDGEQDGGASTMGGGMSTMGGGMSTMGGFGGHGAASAAPATVPEVASPETETKPAVQIQSAAPPMPYQHQQQQQQRPPRSPRSPRRGMARSPPRPTSKSAEAEVAELAQLREAHQKLRAEVVSLRAKAADVSDDERERREEMKQLAGEVGRLSLELSELKESIMEGRVKLAETVGILKMQMEKKESLETQVADARETHEALTSATEAVSEANDLAMAQQAKAVAAAAAAKEKEEAEAESAPVVETADLFSWDAPVPTPVPAVQQSDPMGMGSWGSDASAPAAPTPAAPTPAADAPSVHTATVQEPAPATWGAPVDAGPPATPGRSSFGVPPTPGKDEHDHFSVYSAGTSNPNPYAGFQGMGMGGAPMGGGDLFGGAMGGAPVQQQPVFTPMGGANPAPATYDSQPSAESAPSRESFASVASTAASEKPAPKSPNKAELQALKSETVKAEKDFQTCMSLIRNISVEVEQLESAAKKAETEMKAIEGTTKKGKFGGKKKKAKKEYEKAMEIAQQERNKVKEANAQLAAAERESAKAKKEMESYREKYEQMELEAATAASYLSVQQNESMSTTTTAATTVQQNDSQSVAGQSVATNQYHLHLTDHQSFMTQDDPHGGMMNHPPAPAAKSSDPYGMGLMGGAPGGGGDYANPFTI